MSPNVRPLGPLGQLAIQFAVKAALAVPDVIKTLKLLLKTSEDVYNSWLMKQPLTEDQHTAQMLRLGAAVKDAKEAWGRLSLRSD